MESSSVCNHRIDKQNRTTAKRESDLLITKMIMENWAPLSPVTMINHNHYNFRTKNIYIYIYPE